MKVGQLGIGGYRYGVGITYVCQDVKIIFDAHTAEFVVVNSQEEEIR